MIFFFAHHTILMYHHSTKIAKDVENQKIILSLRNTPLELK